VAVKRARREWDSVAALHRDTMKTMVPATVLPSAVAAASSTAAPKVAVATPRKSIAPAKKKAPAKPPVRRKRAA